MGGRAWLILLVVVGLAFGGCGSTKKTTTPTADVGSTGPRAKSVTYSVKLGPAPRGGAPDRSGHVVISIKGDTDEMCWEFSQLTGVTQPREAKLEAQLHFGFIAPPLGAEYVASRCVSRPRALLRLLEANAHKFYVVVFGRNPLEGGLRGRL